MNVWPVFSPDGKKIAYLSNKGSDYAGTDLYLMNRDGAAAKIVKGGVSSRPAFSADGKTHPLLEEAQVSTGTVRP